MTGRRARRVTATLGAALVLTVGTVSRAAAPSLSAAATVRAAADRAAVSWSPTAACDLTTVRAVSARHPGTSQVIVVSSASFAATTARVDVAVRVEGTWRCQWSGLPAALGRAGTRPLAERRSGDGTTPAGVFPLGVVTAWDGDDVSVFGNRPDPGVRVPYREVEPEDCWGATPGTARYQHLVARPRCAGPDEWLPSYGDVYAHAAVIGANLDPVSGDEPSEPPLAAAIFLHRHSYDAAGRARPTSGCVSLGIEDLVGVLRDLDPALTPTFAIGPVDWLRSTA